MSTRRSKTILVLLLVVPALVNIYTPLYNRASPYLGGLPFFYWFQILLLLLCVIPYLAFSYLQKGDAEES